MGPDLITEEVHLSSDGLEPEEPERGPRRVVSELVQRNRARGISARFLLCDDGHLYVEERGLRGERRYDVHLSFLVPDPQRRIVIASLWFYLFAAAGGLAVVSSLAAASPLAAYAPGVLVPATVIFGTLAAIFFLTLLHRSRIAQSFRSRTGGIDLVQLMAGRPSRKALRGFLAQMRKAILAAERRFADPARQLAAELSEHRRLFEAGILDQPGYELAKARILRSHNHA